MTPQLVLIEDHPALREGLRLLLDRHGIDVVGVGANAAEAHALVALHAPDVAVIDVDLGADDGIALTRELTQAGGSVAVVLYTGAADAELMMAGLEAGARGFALKTGRIEDLLDAIAAVVDGRTYVDPHLRDARPVRATLAPVPAPRRPAATLSAREREILNLLADGLTGEQVAERLFLSAETIKTHVRNAMTKLGATTRVQAVALALRGGHIDAHASAAVSPQLASWRLRA